MSKTPTTTYPFIKDDQLWKGLVANEIRQESIIKKKVLSRTEIHSVVIRLKKDLLVKEYEEKEKYHELRKQAIYYNRSNTVKETIDNIKLRSIESYSNMDQLFAEFLVYVDRISRKATNLLFPPFKIQSIVMFLKSLTSEAFTDLVTIIMTSFLKTKDSYGFDRFKKESIYTLFQLLCNIFADQYSYTYSKEMEVNKIYDLDLLINWNLITSINRSHEIYIGVKNYIDHYYEMILVNKKKESKDNGLFDSINDSEFKKLYEQHTLIKKQQDFKERYENKFSSDLLEYKDHSLYEYHYNQYQSKFQKDLDNNIFDGISLDAWIYETKESILLNLRDLQANKIYASRITFEHPERSKYLHSPNHAPFIYSNNSDDYSAAVNTTDDSRLHKHALLNNNQSLIDQERSETDDSEMTLDNNDIIKEQEEEILEIEKQTESPKDQFSFGFNSSLNSPIRRNFSSY